MPIPESALTLERPILRESAYERLRGWIVQGVLQPGEQLRDNDLALRLGVSRTPVREALRRLEDEGLVETAKNRWTRVATADLRDARRIYPIRAALEPLALTGAFAHLGPTQIKAMKVANTQLKIAIEAQDVAGAVAADAAFHDSFIGLCQNPELIEVLQGLKAKHERLERIYFGSAELGLGSVKDHARLIKAIESGDLGQSLAALGDNWNNCLKRLKP
jgi:DNA-binding GntR family transcriptional regulator